MRIQSDRSTRLSRSPSLEGSVPTIVQEILPSTLRRHRHRLVILVRLLWVMGVLGWALTDGLRPQSEQNQVIALATALTTLGFIGAAASSGDLDVRTALARLKLGPWMAIGFSLVFGLATLTWLGDFNYYRGFVTRSSLVPAGTVAGAGFLALIVAYCSTPSLLRRWGSQTDRFLRGGGYFLPGARSVWTLWGVAVSAQAIVFARGTFGYLSPDPSTDLSPSSSANAVLSVLTQLGLLATVVAGWRFAVNRRPGPMVLLMWISGSQLLLGLFAAQKEAAIIQLVAVVVGYSARGKLRLAPLAVFGLVVLFVISPFVTAYRTVVVSGSSRLSPVEALQSVDFYKLIGGSTTQDGDSSSLDATTARWSRIGDVAIIVANTPNKIGYISPVELVGGPLLGFVPRSVWPNKPLLHAGYEANKLYYQLPANVYSSAAVTPYGDLYRHGGVWVVIVGMAILGMFVRTVDDRGGAGSDIDPRLFFLPMLLFVNLVKQEIDYLALSASLVSTVLAAALAVRLVSRNTMPNS